VRRRWSRDTAAADQTAFGEPMSALKHIADSSRTSRQVRKVPTDIQES
jgi:hypothetical protein